MINQPSFGALYAKAKPLQEATINHKKGDQFHFRSGDVIKVEQGEVKVVDIVVSSGAGKAAVAVHYDWKTLDGKSGSDNKLLQDFIKSYL